MKTSQILSSADKTYTEEKKVSSTVKPSDSEEKKVAPSSCTMLKKFKGASYAHKHGIPTDTDKPRATYPIRSGNRIKHYSNTSENKEGTAGAYADIISTIENAKHLILIAGWLFEPQYYLPCYESAPRDKNGNPLTLGQLLVQQAIQNPEMEIAILTWQTTLLTADHKKSLDYLTGIAKDLGLKDLPPNLQLRQASRTGVLWTHHQKFIVTDTVISSESDKRELVTFYGSADLAGGRFDWHEHPITDTEKNGKIITKLFRTQDIYRPAGKIANTSTPRQAWREIQSQARGPVAQDMLVEFTRRWCAGDAGAFSSYSGSKDNARIIKLLDPKSKINALKSPTEEKDKTAIWDAQVVRSGESCMYAGHWSLKKSYEKSIHKAYLQAIAQAEQFIYIENQYITMDTESSPDTRKNPNRIPEALVKRIIEQHHAGKPFHIFIILPMVSDNDSIHHVQSKTMRWMMQKIEEGTGEFWGKYLSFHFFGQWHKRHPLYNAKYNSDKTTRPELISYSEHGDIYVHSKFIIVDDKLIINGSPNLNQRSMGGPFDSEIAIYQRPHPGCEETCIAETQAFRRHIWKTYFGLSCLEKLGEEGFQNPHLPENVAIIHRQAITNLRHFMIGDEEADANSGYLLTWPFKPEASCNGEMEKGCEFLPDTLKRDKEKWNPRFMWLPPDLAPAPLVLRFAKALGRFGHY